MLRWEVPQPVNEQTGAWAITARIIGASAMYPSQSYIEVQAPVGIQVYVPTTLRDALDRRSTGAEVETNDARMCRYYTNAHDRTEAFAKMVALGNIQVPCLEQIGNISPTRDLLAILCANTCGFSDKKIGAELDLPLSTVKSRQQRIFDSLGAKNRIHAVRRGFETGLIKVGGRYLSPKEEA